MGARNVRRFMYTKGNRDRYLRGRDGEGELYGTLRALLRAVLAVRRGTAESRAARIHRWKNGISEVIVDRVFDRRVHFVVEVGCKIRNVIVRHDAHCDAAAVRGRAFYLKVADGGGRHRGAGLAAGEAGGECALGQAVRVRTCDLSTITQRRARKFIVGDARNVCE